MLRRAIAD
jgi:hypothetical protein